MTTISDGSIEDLHVTLEVGLQAESYYFSAAVLSTAVRPNETTVGFISIANRRASAFIPIALGRRSACPTVGA